MTHKAPLVISGINNFLDRLGVRPLQTAGLEAFIKKEIDFLLQHKKDLLRSDAVDATLFSFDKNNNEEKVAVLNRIALLQSTIKEIVTMMPKVVVCVRKEVWGEPLPPIIGKIFEAATQQFEPASDADLLTFLSENNEELDAAMDVLQDQKTTMFDDTLYDFIENPSVIVYEEIYTRMKNAERFLLKICMCKKNSTTIEQV